MNPDLERALERAAAATVLVVACDFDGTLSPIVPNPAGAAPDRLALERLYGLAALPQTRVLIISGRARDDLEGRLGTLPPGVDLVGSHGAESADERDGAPHPDVRTFTEKLREVVERFPGSELERKPFSVACHLRQVAEQDQARARQDALDRVGPLAAQVKEGKKVIEFMAVPADKGSALERYRTAHAATATVFVGDDVTDEAAFRILAPGDLGVKVGPGPTAASYRLAARAGVVSLLSRLLRYRSDSIGG